MVAVLPCSLTSEKRTSKYTPRRLTRVLGIIDTILRLCMRRSGNNQKLTTVTREWRGGEIHSHQGRVGHQDYTFVERTVHAALKRIEYVYKYYMNAT